MPDRAIVFDLDGTLVDTSDELWQATNHVLALNGRPPIGLDQARAFVGHGARALIARGFAATGAAIDPAAMEPQYEAFVTYYEGHIGETSRPFPGAIDLIERARAAGLKLGVCTNKLEFLSKMLLEKIDLARYFGAIVGPDTLGVSKPDAAPYREALRQLGDAGMPSVMIGDSETDILTARAAGVPVIGVTFGYTARPVAEFAPDAVVDHFDEVWPHLIRLELVEPEPVS